MPENQEKDDGAQADQAQQTTPERQEAAAAGSAGDESAQSLSPEDLRERGRLVANFVQSIVDGADHPNSLRVGVISQNAGDRLSDAAQINARGAVEVVIADSVVQAGNRHPDLRLEDWARLPEVTNTFDEADVGRESRDKRMTRIVLRKRTGGDGSGYGAVYDFAAGGSKGRKKLNLVTYFWGTEKSLDAWWQKNKGADPAAVPNFPEPVLNTRDDVSAPSTQSLPQIPAKAQGPAMVALQKQKAKRDAEAAGLTSPTAEQIRATEEAKAAAARAEKAAKAADDARAKLEQERKEIAQRSEAAADTFELGQDAEANLSGQGELLGGDVSLTDEGKTRVPYPTPLKGQPAYIEPAQRVVVDFMNGDIDKAELLKRFADLDLTEAQIRSVTNRIDITKDEIDSVKAMRSSAAGQSQPKPETQPQASNGAASVSQPETPQDFIPAPDGGLDYGEITSEMSKAMRRQAGKIRLTRGVQNADGTGHGLVHIEANHGKQIRALGFNSIEAFVAHVAGGIQQVWQVPGNSQLLVTTKNGRKDVMFIRLEIAKDGDFYRVNSAFPVRQPDYEAQRDMKKIWDGSEPTSAVTGQRPAFATAAIAAPDSESSQGSSNARGQNVSVPLATPDTQASEADATSKPAKIEDSGEVLEGARKLYAKSYAAKLDEGTGMDTASVPLSKSWPEPDYQRLIDEGADPWAVALARAVRDEIPIKPVKAWKLKGWVAKVEGLREMAQEAMNGSLTKEKFTAEAAKFKLDEWLNKVDLYEAVGHAESLKGMKFSANTYSFFGGQKFDPPKKLWTVNAPSTSASATWSNGNWGNDLVVADTKAEAIAKFKAWVAEQAAKAEDGQGKPAGKRTEFHVYSYRNNPKVFIVGKRISATKSIDLMEFESSKEANAFIVANQDKLEAMLAEAKAEQSERGEENSPRVGDDHRNGADVTTEQFREAFGFRGEQFGASMPQAERQANMNQAYDALMDLAGVIGVPPKALSLNGELGLAFGARGTGGKNPAMAHYEADTTGEVTPNRVVINLTRKNGAGSLAHEWFHAVGNYFARQRGGEVSMQRGAKAQDVYRNNNFITYRPEPLYVHKTVGAAGALTKGQLNRYREKNPNSGYFAPENWQVDPRHPNGVRPEVERAFADVVEALDESPMSKRAAALDKTPEAYWSQIIERGARAFENYVISKMMEKGYQNDYLANVRPIETFPRSRDRYPYLLPEEVAPIAQAFDVLFGTIQTKETENGVAVYERLPAYGNDAEGFTTTPTVNENTGAYETDLFGNPLPTAAKRPSATKPAPARVRGDAQPAGPVQDTPAPAGEYLVKTTIGSEVNRKMGTDKVLNASDLATATSYLYRSAVERFDGVVTDKKGKVLGVVGGFKGAISQTAIYPATVMAEAIRIPGAAHIWFSHNHPSGKSSLSNADEQLWQVMANTFRGSGLEPMGLIAVGGDEFTYTGQSAFGPPGPTGAQNTPIPKAKGEFSVPVMERVLPIGRQSLPTAISSPADAKARAKIMFERAGKRPGIMMLNTQNQPVGWLPVDGLLRGKLRDTGGMNALFRAASESNMAAAIFVHDGDLDAKVGTGVNAGNNIAAALQLVDIRTLDILKIRPETYSDGSKGLYVQSLAESGMPISAGPVFSRKSGGAGMAKAEVQSIADAIKSQWANAPEVVVVESMDDPAIPQAVRDANNKAKALGAKGEPEGFYLNGKVYVIADQMGKPGDVIRVMFHESLGHAGLRGVFGKSLDGVLRQIVAARRALVIKKARQYGLVKKGADGKAVVDVKTATDDAVFAAMSDADRMTAAEEVLAEMAQDKPELSWVQNAIAAVRQWLRDHVPGFTKMVMTDAEIVRQFLVPARGFVERGRAAGNASMVPAFNLSLPDAQAAKLLALADSALAGGNENTTVVVRPVTWQEAQFLQGEGVPVDDGFAHTADMFAVRHALNRHGNPKIEESRGQLPLTAADVAAIQDMVDSPDAFILGLKTPRGQDVIGLIRRMPDGTILYLEEVRSGRKTLAMTSMRKYPGTSDFDAIKRSTLPTNAQSDTGDVRIVYPKGAEGQGSDTPMSRSTDKADTPAFKKWFGDSVVTESGKAGGVPKVVYHGSPDVRGIISSGFKPSISRGDVFFFTGSEKVANTYADPKRAWDHQNAEDNVLPLYLSMQNPMIVDAKGRKWRDTERFVQEAKDNGHDGIIIKNSRDEYNNTGDGGESSTVYAVFKPTQIKSAAEPGILKSRFDGRPIGDISNNGNFDPENPSILFSRRSTDEAMEFTLDGRADAAVELVLEPAQILE